MSLKSLFSLSALMMAALIFAGPAMAIDEEGLIPIKSYEGKKEYSYWILNPEELVTCLGLGGDMLSLRQDIPRNEKKLADLKDKIKMLGAAIEKKRAQEKLDQADLDMINNAVKTFNQLNASHATLTTKYNGQVEKLNESLEIYNNKCAGKKFYQEDYNAMMKGRSN
ncbi:MAG: hypothetical protein OEZ32_08415 [Nitrospinota bacterium]|nr:hypothetical protein [Nitrospinota bacterium]